MAYRVSFHCDRCGDGFVWVDTTVTYNFAIRIARSKGWQVGKKGWFCPNCRQTKRKKENDNA